MAVRIATHLWAHRDLPGALLRSRAFTRREAEIDRTLEELLELVRLTEFRHVPDDSDLPRANLLADGLTDNQRRARFAVEPVDSRRCRSRLSRMNGFGPRLQYIQLASNPVFGPLNIHGQRVSCKLGVMILD